MTASSSLTGIHDIIYHIISHLAPVPKSDLNTPFEDIIELRPGNRKALARLARTHSSFTKPALAEIWRSLPDQKVLEYLLCVVGIARRGPRQQADRSALELCGAQATHRAGWTRFREYASLVREITIDPLGPFSRDLNLELLEDTFWCQLFAVFGDSMPILPRLERAIVRSTDHYCSVDTGMLRLLNCPSIREFRITFLSASWTDIKQIGKALAPYFSSMQHLEVLSLEVPALKLLLDMETLRRVYPHLRGLNLGGDITFQLSHLRPIATLPNLECLSIKAIGLEPLDFPLMLPGLRTLAVSVAQFAAISTFLDHVDAPQLRTFSVSETHRHSDDLSQKLSGLLRTLVAKFPSLTAFEWDSNQLWIRKRGFLRMRLSDAPLAELLAPLLVHRTLRHFSVSLRGPIVPYTPADFHAMAEAWPDLETFHLCDKIGDGDSIRSGAAQYADPECIVAFADHCRGLRILWVPTVQFDPSSAFACELARGARAQHWLRELSVDHAVVRLGERPEDGDCDGEDVVQFWDVMEKVFPCAVMHKPTRK